MLFYDMLFWGNQQKKKKYIYKLNLQEKLDIIKTRKTTILGVKTITK